MMFYRYLAERLLTLGVVGDHAMIRQLLAVKSRLKHCLRTILCIACAFSVGHALAAPIKVVVRYDDFSGYGNAADRLPLDRSIFEAVGGMKGSTLVGVIPYPGVDYPLSADAAAKLSVMLSGEKLRLLTTHAKAGTVVVALHGFNHRPSSFAAVRSEFVGLSQVQQTLLIGSARRSLEAVVGVSVRVFIPPFNTYDSATLRALADTGFDLVSANSDQPADAGLSTRYLPGGVYPGFLKRTVQDALSRGVEDVLIVTTVHPYDFIESGESLSKFRKDSQIPLAPFLRDLRELYDAGLISVASAADLEKSREDLSVDRYIANKTLRNSWIKRLRLIPDFLSPHAVDGVYYTRAAAERMQAQQIGAAIGVYGGVMLLAAAAIYRLVRRAIVRRRFAQDVGIALVLSALLALAAKPLFGSFYHSLAIGLAAIIGVAAGAIAGQLSQRRSSRRLSANSPSPG